MDRYGNGEEIVLDKVFDVVACKPSFQYFSRELFTGELLGLFYKMSRVIKSLKTKMKM